MAAGDCRVSKFSVQVLGDRTPRTHWTRQYAEVLGTPPTASTQVSRFAAQTLGDRTPRTHLTRVYSEILGTTPTPKTYLSRFSVQVLGDGPVIPANVRFTRMYAEVLGAAPVPSAQVSRFSVQVLGDPVVAIPETRVSRFGSQVLGKARVRTLLSRFSVQVLFDGVLGAIRVIPNALPSVLANIFSHNWASRCVVESAYGTDITAAATSVAEERRAVVDRPYRTLQIRFTGFDRFELTRLSMTLARLCSQRSTPVPLVSDFSKVTATSSGTTIHCDTRYRRFFLNGRVLIHSWDANRRPANVEYGQIQAMGVDNITLQAPLVGSFPAGSRVYPCLEAEIDLEKTMDLLSDENCDLQLTVRERSGRSALPSSVGQFVNPDGFPTHGGRPIFDVGHDWSANLRSGVYREGSKFASGRAEIISAFGARPQMERELRMILFGRDKFWKVLNFFDSRRGRMRSFWLVEPAAYFQPTVLQTTQVTVKAAGNIQDVQDFIKYVAVVKRDGTTYIRGISSVTPSGADWVIAFDAVIPSTSLADVRKVTPAYLVRLKDDSLREEWITDEHMETSLAGIEVLEEAAQELSALTFTPTGPAPAQVVDLYLWTSPNRHTWADAGRVAKASPGADPGSVGAAVALWDDARSAPSSVNLLGSSAPGQIVYADPETNNGRPAATFAGVAGKWNLRPLGDTFYDNTAGKGLTVFVAFRVGVAAGTWTALLKKTGVLEWYPTQCKMFETLDGEVANNNINHASLMADDLGRNVLAVLRWDPNVSARVYKNGGSPLGSAVTPVVDLPAEATRELDVWAMTSQLDVNDLVIYKRALTTAELNKVGKFLASKYDSPWVDIV